MEIEEILSQLETSDDVVPVVALAEAVDRPVEMIPVLVSILEYTAGHAEDVIENKRLTHIFAMMLLAQYREKSAYQPIFEIFSLPGETSLDLTGDFVTEYLMRVLASVCCGDITLIQQLVENPEVNEYVRSAALRSLLVLVASDELYREEAVDYISELFYGKLESTPGLVWCTLVDCCGELHITELEGEVVAAFTDGRVDPEFVSLEQVKDRLQENREEVLQALTQNPTYTIVYDVVAELVG